MLSAERHFDLGPIESPFLKAPFGVFSPFDRPDHSPWHGPRRHSLTFSDRGDPF
jgi:hypothetical protein